MHYRKRGNEKVQTQKYTLDARLFDLLAISAKKKKKSRNVVVEQAIIELCREPKLPLIFKTKVRKKFLITKETEALLLDTCDELGISQNALINKALKEFLTNKRKNKT